MIKRAFFGYGSQIVVSSAFVRFSICLYKKKEKKKSYLEKIYKKWAKSENFGFFFVSGLRDYIPATYPI